jgi:hypothetical protein
VVLQEPVQRATVGDQLGKFLVAGNADRGSKSRSDVGIDYQDGRSLRRERFS